MSPRPDAPIPVLAATRLARDVLARTGAAPNGATKVTVHSVHRSTANVVAPGTDLLLNLTADQPSAPAQARVGLEVAALVPGSEVSLYLADDCTVVDLDTPRIGPPDAAASRPLADAIAPHLARSWFATDEGREHGLPALEADDPLRLLGLGPGLTPSGDDVLVGRIAWARATSQPADALREAVDHADERTTSVSATLLRAALRGETSAALNGLLAAVSADDHTQLSSAVADVAATGHTSGADLLFGLHHLLTHHLTRPPTRTRG